MLVLKIKYFKSVIFHFVTLEEVLMKPKASRKKELMRVRVKISEIQNRKLVKLLMLSLEGKTNNLINL